MLDFIQAPTDLTQTESWLFWGFFILGPSGLLCMIIYALRQWVWHYPNRNNWLKLGCALSLLAVVSAVIYLSLR